MKTIYVGGCAVAAVFTMLAMPRAAQAGIDACGNIDVEANAQCELVPPGVMCEAECTPIAVEASCAAQLTLECEGTCTGSASASCTGSCEGDCMIDCEADPGQFDCQAACEADCDGACDAQCSTAEDGAQCMASCQATCSASCDASCDIEAPEADCQSRCEASCGGSCEARANLDCQIDCQRETFANCEAEVTGGCEVACQGERGALFCDGQYIDHGNQLDECVDALRAALDIEVMGYATGSSSCDGGVCMAMGEAGASCECAALPGGPGSGRSLPAAGLLAGALALLWQRRRRRAVD